MTITATPLSSPIALGRTAEVYDWDEHHILKLYHAWCPPDWAEHEARVCAVIVAAGIPTPAIREVVTLDGRQGIVYQRVQGVSMLRDLNARPWKFISHARALADLQLKFKSITVPGLTSNRTALGNAIRRVEAIPEDLRARLLEILDSLPEEKTLCHGDFHPGNVLLSPDGPVVIDWMTAVAGSPWADVARTSLLLNVGARSAGKQVSLPLRLVVSLYRRAYLERYCSAWAGTAREYERWLPVIAAARLDERIEAEREALVDMVRGLLS